MSLSSTEQFKKFLEASKEILILIPENPSADAVGSAWALYYFLKERGSSPAIVFSNNLNQKFSFLPRPKNILNEISGARDFVLSFDTTRNKIMGIRHEEKDGRFNIMVTPEKGSVDPRDFSFVLAKFNYDLVIVLDSPDLEKLGKIYTENSDLFFEVPLVNIDHRSDNENFGQINLVDVTTSSCAEIIYDILENFDNSLINKKIATCLLTGIIGATDRFQKKNTTPKSLSIASVLMAKEADQQEIIRWLFKTQPLHILKLWGRAMAKINWDKENNLAWSVLAVEDFVQSRSTIQDAPLVLEKLEENYSEGKIFMVIYNDTPESAVANIRSSQIEIMKKMFFQFEGDIKRGTLEIKIKDSNLENVSRILSEKIKTILKK